MELIDVSRNNIQGGSLIGVVQIKRGASKTKESVRDTLSLEKKFKLDNLDTFKNFSKNLIKTKNNIKSLIKKIKNEKKTIAGFGAARSGTTLITQMEIGDYIEYIDKQIYINGRKYKLIQTSKDIISIIDLSDNYLFIENNGQAQYPIMKNESRDQSFSYTVPDDTYFVLGDNRDNSNDSRYWGPVPESHLIGKAFLVWMHLNPSGSYSVFDRIGKSID